MVGTTIWSNTLAPYSSQPALRAWLAADGSFFSKVSKSGAQHCGSWNAQAVRPYNHMSRAVVPTKQVLLQVLIQLQQSENFARLLTLSMTSQIQRNWQAPVPYCLGIVWHCIFGGQLPFSAPASVAQALPGPGRPPGCP